MKRIALLGVLLASCQGLKPRGDKGPTGYYVLDGVSPAAMRTTSRRAPFTLKVEDVSNARKTILLKISEESSAPVSAEDDQVAVEFHVAKSLPGRTTLETDVKAGTVTGTTIYHPVPRLVIRNKTSSSIRADGRSILYRAPGGSAHNLLREEMIDKSDQFVDMIIPADSKIDSRFVAASWLAKKDGEWRIQQGLDSVRIGETFAILFRVQGVDYEIRIRRE